MPTSDGPAGFIPKERLTAYERWELASFGAPPAPKAGAAPQAAEPAAPQVKLPTADDIERIHQEAHKAGYAAGYEEGTARARVEALRLHTLAENLEKSLVEMDQQVAQDLLSLALEVARQVVRQALAVKPELIIEVVRETLMQLPHQHAAIFLHPDDASLVRSYLGDTLTHAGHRILEEPGIARGGCRIEAGGSQIDASVETRWRRVLEALGRTQNWIDKGDGSMARP